MPRYLKGGAIVLWDKHTLLGASVIEAIETGSTVKTVYRCGRCGKASIKARKRLQPRFRCDSCGTEFETPTTTTERVTTYRVTPRRRLD